MLVELACAATLTPAYNPSFFAQLVSPTSPTQKKKSVVFIVCGGFKISLDEIEEYRRIVRASLENDGDSWEVMYNGEKSFVAK